MMGLAPVAVVDVGAILRGQEIYEALVVEVFCGTGRVTACLRRFGMSLFFGVDHVRPRNFVAPVSLVDLTTSQPREVVTCWQFGCHQAQHDRLCRKSIFIVLGHHVLDQCCQTAQVHNFS